jgi:hypothetical protein
VASRSEVPTKVPGQSYRLESDAAPGNAGAWPNGVNVSLTNALRILPAASSAESSRFYRTRKL